jgi:regulator of sigma E protease
MQNIKESTGDKIKVVVDRKGEMITFEVEPQKTDAYYLGVLFKVADKSIANNIYYGFWETVDFSVSILDNLRQIFGGKISTDQLMGPVGISGEITRTEGAREFIFMIALISLSLGVTNLLPFPPLDGGKIVILIIEAIRRKPLKESVEIGIQTAGFALLIGLSIYVTYKDILRIF